MSLGAKLPTSRLISSKDWPLRPVFNHLVASYVTSWAQLANLAPNSRHNSRRYVQRIGLCYVDRFASQFLLRPVVFKHLVASYDILANLITRDEIRSKNWTLFYVYWFVNE